MSVAVETQPVCLLRLSGGLGNQMFQYAAGRSLALKTDSSLVLDVSFYNTGRHRKFELEQFPIQAELRNQTSAKSLMARGARLVESLLRRERVYREPHFHFDPRFEAICPPVTLNGYFQTYRYFEGIQEQIREELNVPDPTDADTLNLIQKMSEQDYAVLHIRRGDYVSSTKASRIYSQCSLDYYQNAMKLLPENYPVLILSDDLPWARTNLPPIRPLVFPHNNSNRPGLADLWLMTRARHHIIANSSFSWWGAWLARKQGGLKIAPKRWFNDSTINDTDLTPGDWIRI